MNSTPSSIIIDSWAWIEYLDGSRSGENVRKVITDESRRLYTHPVSVAEIVSKVKRKDKDPEIAWKAIINLTTILQVEESDPKQVGLLHAQLKANNKNFGLADAFVLHAARKIQARVLTGDPDFRGMSEAIFLRD